MKKFFTLILVAVMAVAANTAQAQFRHHGGFERGRGYSDWTERVYYGFKLGFNASHISSDDPRLDGGSVQCGLNTGVAVGMYLSDYHPISIESGIYYTAKGGKNNDNGTKVTYDLNYLELPIVFKYKVFMPQDFSIEPFLGAFAAVGVGGKVKNHATRDTHNSFSKDYFRRGDGGLRLGCGVTFQMVNIEAAYDIGLTNIAHDDFDTAHNRNFTLTAGITF